MRVALKPYQSAIVLVVAVFGIHNTFAYSSNKGIQGQTIFSLTPLPSSPTTIPPRSTGPNSIIQASAPSALHRKKRNINPKVSAGVIDIQQLFPSNTDNEALQKWLSLLTKSKGAWIEEYDDDRDEDYDASVIDLVHGKKPGSMKGFAGGNSRVAHVSGVGGEWAGDEQTRAPISLQQHRMNKKSSLAALIPELILRNSGDSKTKFQPDSHFMRWMLVHGNSRSPLPSPRSIEIDTDENTNGHLLPTKQLYRQNEFQKEKRGQKFVL